MLATGFWYRWFGGQWQEPQLVLLDHGLIVEIPDALRQQYCQLWCSFVLNDHATAASVATQIAGLLLSLSSEVNRGAYPLHCPPR